MHKQNLHVASLISGGKRERERERERERQIFTETKAICPIGVENPPQW